jgi:hypothetical protein
LGQRWRYEKQYLKSKVSDLWQMLYYKWYIRRPMIKRRGKQIFYQPEVKRLAKEYYEKINDAFAKYALSLSLPLPPPLVHKPEVC